MQVRCPHCHTPIDFSRDDTLADVACPSCGSRFDLLGSETVECAPGFAETIGHFELLEQLGAGAFGTVWKARDTQLDRIVAVKIPRAGELDPETAEQFLREARAAAQLRHPNIVGVHEVGRENGRVYIVSDFIDGVTLADWLTGQRLTQREAADLCARIAEALHHAHEAGVVHRDLKPANVMLSFPGAAGPHGGEPPGRNPAAGAPPRRASEVEPHVMDFGLAKRETGEVAVTIDGSLKGTPAYMSPEQAQGSAHLADRRSDVYSLGVILYQMLTGELPFRGNLRMMLHQVIHDEPPSPRRLDARISRDLETVCLKCLEKDPRRRYATAGALADELRRILRGEPIQARPVGRWERGWRWCRRNPAVAALSALAALLLVAVATVTSVAYWQEAGLRAEVQNALTELTLDRLVAETNYAVHDIEELLREARVNARQMPRFPPLPGLLRSLDNGGTDPRIAGMTAEAWIDQLAMILAAQMEEDVERRRCGFVDEDGREIVRVEYRDGHPRLVPSGEGTYRGDDGFYRKAGSLAAGEVYVSPMRLERDEEGVIRPPRPMVHVATPVFDEQDRQRGVFYIAVDGGHVLELAQRMVRTGSLDIVDERGVYLYCERDPSKAFGDELGHGHRYADEMPIRAGILARGAEAPDTYQAFVPGPQRWDRLPLFATYRKIHYDPRDRTRFWAVAPSVLIEGVGGEVKATRAGVPEASLRG